MKRPMIGNQELENLIFHYFKIQNTHWNLKELYRF